MNTEHNDSYLKAAERIDALRVVPRLIMAVYFGFFIYAWLFVTSWFMAFDWETIKDAEAIALAVAGFPAIILGVLSKVLSTLIQNYNAGGRKWGSDELG